MPEQKKYPELAALKGKIREEESTYRESAEKLSIQVSTFSKKINGESTFKLHEVAIMVDFLNIDPEEINRYFFPNILRNARNEG